MVQKIVVEVEGEGIETAKQSLHHVALREMGKQTWIYNLDLFVDTRSDG